MEFVNVLVASAGELAARIRVRPWRDLTLEERMKRAYDLLKRYGCHAVYVTSWDSFYIDGVPGVEPIRKMVIWLPG